MINLLHTYLPEPILFSFGPLSIHWYGLFIVIGIIAALLVSFRLGKKYYHITRDEIFDLSFWLIIWGIIGARIYDVFLQLPYYINHPAQVLEIWKGGLAIHGAIIAGLIVIYYFSKKRKIEFFKLTALLVPGLALGQAIGRFGNYFNQELFGLPTNLPWGIPISIFNRPADYITYQYFQPTFLYESLGCFLIFLLLYNANRLLEGYKTLNKSFYVWSTVAYMVLYSLLRFSLEFIRVDYAPILFGLRLPQVMSLVIIFISILVLIIQKNVWDKRKNKK
ncbi:MAG: prolipoprotein diacylglyceryl transferase [Patescibacteria group bacterium]